VIKRPRSRRTKEATKRPEAKRVLALPRQKNSKSSSDVQRKPSHKYAPWADLPPNEEVRKFADEIWGNTEMPSRSRGK
jgi:hypothetical protein